MSTWPSLNTERHETAHYESCDDNQSHFHAAAESLHSNRTASSDGNHNQRPIVSARNSHPMPLNGENKSKNEIKACQVVR